MSPETPPKPDGGATDVAKNVRVVPLPAQKKPAVAQTGGLQVAVIQAELVTLFALHLPVKRKGQRRAAAGFAVEPFLAEPLEETHVALGPLIRDQTYLVAAVAHRHMAGWLDRPVIAEQMTLPPPQSAGWQAVRTGDRVLVRAQDGTGFAISPGQLEPLWIASGRPNVLSLAEPLPHQINAVENPGAPPKPRRKDLAFDLRQGRYSPSPSILRRSASAGLAVIVLAGGLQLGLRAPEVNRAEVALNAERDAVTETLQRLVPGLPLTAQTPDALARLLNRQAQPSEDAFLTMMRQTSRGLLTAGDQVSLLSLSYTGRGAVMTLQLRATGIDALRQAGAALATTGLQVDGGAVVATDGGAETTLTLQGDGE